MFKEHEKFCAFMVLVASIVLLAIIATTLGGVLTKSATINEAAQQILAAKLRILELIAVGLIGIAGAAGQAIFRANENAKDMNELLRATVEKLGDSIPNPPTTPAPQNVQEAADQVANAALAEADNIAGADTSTGTGDTHDEDGSHANTSGKTPSA